MGTSSSTLKQEELEALERSSHFSQREIQRLYKRFKKLDRSGAGGITESEFLQIPELAMNPLARRVIALFACNTSERVDFREFIHTLSAFGSRADDNVKLQFAFRVYDVDNDGYISNADLTEVLKAMVGANLNEAQLAEIVEKTIVEHDLDRDGKLSPAEFAKILEPSDLRDRFTVRM
ncbi:putative Calcineurin subunit B [Paratrimastix pyriformis]|uniref:Calcineurin subunit B n=1 Tax=Paratrimastix pyriformis TaxID=342808 RepID=A0ABQ8UJF0_9EUKA|nr:putative Calcineurin subunit B [Paratrimastix pyriformis]|eukprot:GAFH01005568.1.p1 GENE.GAFH01005568.1~~GAFH01005568.1.p1  ORF type:complete len:178 (+),score=31.88 GAFH01005568.1:53-586(+)